MVDITEPPASKKNFYVKGYYAVTINPDDKHQYFGKNDRLILFRNYMNELLITLSSYGIEYKFAIELSEPKHVRQDQCGPRLHCHGIIHFCSKKSVKMFLLSELYRLSRHSDVDIDSIEHPTIWITYCDKQQSIIDTPYLSSNDELWSNFLAKYVATSDEDKERILGSEADVRPLSPQKRDAQYRAPSYKSYYKASRGRKGNH